MIPGHEHGLPPAARVRVREGRRPRAAGDNPAPGDFNLIVTG